MFRLRTLVHAVKARRTTLSFNQNDAVRHGSYKNSPEVGDPSLYTDYEVSKSPEEWKYVARLLRLPAVPVPKDKEAYPSGWVPQAVNPDKCTYFVHRTRNHMIPCYLNVLDERGFRRITRLKGIEGDIWQLHKELSEWLYKVSTAEYLGIQCNEKQSQIIIHGDYVNAVKKFLLDRGF